MTTRSLSNDLRKRLIDCVKKGMSARAAGRQRDIAASTATRIVKDWRDRGSYEPLKRGGSMRPVREAEADFIEKRVGEHPDWTEAELNAPLRQERELEVHDTTLGRLVRMRGWHYKKNGTRQRAGS